jgi:hypothetical protein
VGDTSQANADAGATFSEFDIANPSLNPLAAAGASAGTTTGNVIASAISWGQLVLLGIAALVVIELVKR